MIKSMLIAGLGGFAGTILRFLVSRYFQLNYDTVFPWSTLLVNVLGSFIIGIVFGISERSNVMSTEWRLFLAVGICGGFTTFSTFSNDAFILLQGREMFRFVSYAGLSFFLGLVAVFVGRTLVKTL
ncbi:MAG: fluoride efflux transporter CrcB [Bacteroidetes bacterium HGW-Bacteroidetes-4]|jgi:CrcB protein|nr:MAG: fluoride efflux transporter CrcB [Bacteroidetes bacterium HGW-Bacteroidetes-4]